MNYIDLFHGIGGFALGAQWAGMKFDKHFCSDVEPYCQELYKLRFPDSIQLGDITKIDTDTLKEYGTDWIISGGFPCTDISIAGKGEGIYGKRSGLWFEYLRIIGELRPQFAIMENVGMLIKRGLREVLEGLAQIGYAAEWQDIRAEDMGAPHKRERIWIVAYPYVHGHTSPTFGKSFEKYLYETQTRPNKTRHSAGTNSLPQTSGNVANSAGLGCQQGPAFRGTIQQKVRRDEPDIRSQAPNEVPHSYSINGGSVQRTDIKSRHHKKVQGMWSDPRKEKNISNTVRPGLQKKGAKQQTTGAPGNNTEIPDTDSERRKEQHYGIPTGKRDINRFDVKRTNFWSIESGMGGTPDGVPGWLDAHIGRGMSYDDTERARNRLSHVWPNINSEIVKRVLSGFSRTHTAEIIFALVNENTNQQIIETTHNEDLFRQFITELWVKHKLNCPLCKKDECDPHCGEYPQSITALNNFFHDKGASSQWELSSWEDGIPRLGSQIPGRVHRLKGLGNAIVPQIAQLLFERIKDLLEK